MTAINVFKYIHSICRAALLQMASALRKQGELGDAQDYCSVSILFIHFYYTYYVCIVCIDFQE